MQILAKYKVWSQAPHVEGDYFIKSTKFIFYFLLQYYQYSFFKYCHLPTRTTH